MNNKEIVLNIRKAVNGDLEATFNLILQYEKLLDEKCKISGKFNQECKDYVIDHLLKGIRNFKNKKFFYQGWSKISPL